MHRLPGSILPRGEGSRIPPRIEGQRRGGGGIPGGAPRLGVESVGNPGTRRPERIREGPGGRPVDHVFEVHADRHVAVSSHQVSRFAELKCQTVRASPLFLTGVRIHGRSCREGLRDRTACRRPHQQQNRQIACQSLEAVFGGRARRVCGNPQRARLFAASGQTLMWAPRFPRGG